MCLKTILIILAGFIISHASAITKPNSSWLLFQLHYENSTGEKGLTTFSHTPNGLRHTAIWHLDDFSRFSLNSYIYDDNNRLVRLERIFSDSVTLSIQYSYNQDNNIVAETFERSDGVKGTTRFVYDNENRLLHADCQAYFGWFNGKIKYHYNHNRKIKASLYNETTEIGQIHYVYDDQKHLSIETWELGTWQQTFTYVYRPANNKPPQAFTLSNAVLGSYAECRLIREDYDYSGETGGPSMFEYDSNQKLIKKVFKRSDDLTTVTHYFYDQNGVLLKSLRRYSDGKSAVFDYRFDSDKHLTERRFFRSDGVMGNETYQYDKKGALLSGKLTKFDSWLNGILTFSHDNNGRIRSGEFKSETGYTADIDFQYNDRNLPIHIKWNFSFGKYQTYSFEWDCGAL